jgi:hypothetical protein
MAGKRGLGNEKGLEFSRPFVLADALSRGLELQA